VDGERVQVKLWLSGPRGLREVRILVHPKRLVPDYNAATYYPWMTLPRMDGANPFHACGFDGLAYDRTVAASDAAFLANGGFEALCASCVDTSGPAGRASSLRALTVLSELCGTRLARPVATSSLLLRSLVTHLKSPSWCALAATALFNVLQGPNRSWKLNPEGTAIFGEIVGALNDRLGDAADLAAPNMWACWLEDPLHFDLLRPLLLLAFQLAAIPEAARQMKITSLAMLFFQTAHTIRNDPKAKRGALGPRHEVLTSALGALYTLAWHVDVRTAPVPLPDGGTEPFSQALETYADYLEWYFEWYFKTMMLETTHWPDYLRALRHDPTTGAVPGGMETMTERIQRYRLQQERVYQRYADH